MSIGDCRLCGKRRPLRNSHLIPAGIYSIVRAGIPADEHPVLLVDGAAIYSDSQIQAYLLCDDCEDRFNKNGEAWTIAHCWHNPADSPIHTALSAAAPAVVETRYCFYQGNEIAGLDMGRLTYFAASVFWRACVHRWPIGKTRTRLEFGPYERPLRAYLLGEALFPADMVLVINVSSATDAQHNRVMMGPWLSDRSRLFSTYAFRVPGITFRLMIGRRIPADIRKGCSALFGYVLVSPDADERNLRDALGLAGKAPRRGKLRRVGRRDGGPILG